MVLLAFIDFAVALPYAVFGLIAMGAWLMLERLAASSPRMDERLDEFANPALRRRRLEEEKSSALKQTGTVTRLLAMASPAFAKPLQPKDEFETGKLKTRLSHGGFRHESAVQIFLGMKIAGLVIGFLMSGTTLVALARYDQSAVMMAVAFAGVLFYMPDILLAFMAHKRKQEIFLGLPDALDLMVVCVEAGLGLDQAMRKVSEEMKKAYRTIAEEFRLAVMQVQMGRSRNEVLRELGARSGVDDLRALAAILIQADRFGSSVAQALRVQSDSMRIRRSQLAEEKAAKTAVKLIFPLVIFIFPGIFVVLVGPAAITMVREMFPVMNGS